MGHNLRRSKKRKERERRVCSERSERTERRKERFNAALVRNVYRLPEISVIAPDGPEDMVGMVQSGLSVLKHRFPTLIDEMWLPYMREQRKYGWSHAVDSALKNLSESKCWDGRPRALVEEALSNYCGTALGEALVRCIPEKQIRQIGPFAGIDVVRRGDGWAINIKPLKQAQTTHGIVYYSPYEPTAEFEFGRRYITFSKHAIQQMMDRVVPTWYRSYIGLSHVFGFLYECIYFEPTRLVNGQPGFVVWNSCQRVGQEFWDKAKTIIGDNDADRSLHYYRVGYCPVATEGNLSVAKTFLAPGYQGTHEKELFSQKFRKPQRIAPLEQAADDGLNVLRVVTDQRAWETIAWFHKMGIKQVVRMDHEVFRCGGLRNRSISVQPVAVSRQATDGILRTSGFAW